MILFQGGTASVAVVGMQDGFCLQTVTGDDISNLLLAAFLFENLWPEDTDESMAEDTTAADDTTAEQGLSNAQFAVSAGVATSEGVAASAQETVSAQTVSAAQVAAPETNPVDDQETTPLQVQRFCGHCGTPVENSAMRFCPKCGQPLD
uniref:zinc ribbon domain-containing protein n=1 Tax=Ndongobacter massiliensis TaxID=1871025 RepID=UPI000930F233|nr:zinc ribbon domain-containing protein [Ndongobacter massiliensis]